MSSKTSTNLRILLNLDDNLYKIGDITLNRFKGDIYYSPSSKQYLTINSEKEDIIHFAFHKSGYIHLKHFNKPKKLIRKGLSTKRIGYQELFRDLIIVPSKLVSFKKQIKQGDVIFNYKQTQGSILFSLAIISGRLIVKRYKGENTPLNFRLVKDTDKVIGLEKRGLGCGSGNADKLLQFLLIKAEGGFNKMPTKRRIAIIPDQKITNT